MKIGNLLNHARMRFCNSSTAAYNLGLNKPEQFAKCHKVIRTKLQIVENSCARLRQESTLLHKVEREIIESQGEKFYTENSALKGFRKHLKSRDEKVSKLEVQQYKIRGYLLSITTFYLPPQVEMAKYGNQSNPQEQYKAVVRELNNQHGFVKNSSPG